MDLDTSNIKRKPIKIYYKFKGITQPKIGDKKFTDELNTFISDTSKYENPLTVDVRSCENIENNRLFFPINNYIKFHEHLFVYYFQDPFDPTSLDFITYIFIFLSNVIIINLIPKLINEEDNLIIKILIGSSLIFSNIIFYIIYICLKLYFEKIHRIDFVYSRDFDRIFIGIVKYTKTSYINTFDFNMNDIERFILEKEGNNESYNLKVIFKNKDSQQICRMKNRTKNELNNLAYLLNERLTDKTDNLLKITFRKKQ